MWKHRLGYAVVFSTASVLYFFENNTGTRALLTAAVIVPLFSILCAVLASKQAEVTCTLPASGEKDTDISCVVSCSGSKALWGAVVCGQMEAENALTGESLALPFTVGGRWHHRLTLHSAYCGGVHLFFANVVVQDWFGLWRSTPLPSTENYIVIEPVLYPVHVRMSSGQSIAMDAEQWSANRPGSDPSETFGIREYVPGDPVRQIHWKLSEKTDRLMFRELGLPITEDTLLLLETSYRNAPAPADLSGAMEALLSVSQSLIAQGIGHSVGWKNRRNGELELFEVISQQSFAELRQRILTAGSALDDESIGTCCLRCLGGQSFAHTAVFTPHGDTDAISLRANNHVTLVLPKNAETTLPDSGLYAALFPDLAYLEL